MKRDWDVIREVLIEIEEGNNSELSYGDDENPIKSGHAFLLRDAGYISAVDASTMSGRALIAPNLTWEGHDLLATIRSKPVWDRIKSVAKDKGIELSLDAIKALGKVALEWVLSG